MFFNQNYFQKHKSFSISLKLLMIPIRTAAQVTTGKKNISQQRVPIDRRLKLYESSSKVAAAALIDRRGYTVTKCEPSSPLLAFFSRIFAVAFCVASQKKDSVNAT